MILWTVALDSCILDSANWAKANFERCDLGDQRLTNRLVKFATKCADKPDDSTPHQAQSAADCKGAYRMMDNGKLNFTNVTAAHFARTRSLAKSGVWLSICDTTEIAFSMKRQVEGLGKTGNNGGQGFFLHSSLMVSAADNQILGLAGQELFYRIPSRLNESNTQRKKRKRNSEVWWRVVQQVGTPNPQTRIVHDCDRGADDYEFYTHCQQQQCGWVVRAQHLTRKIYVADAKSNALPVKSKEETTYLGDYISAQRVVATYALEIPASKGRSKRTATVEVRIGNVWMPRSSVASPWLKENGPKFIKMGVVEVSEVSRVPKGASKVHWVLLTDGPMVIEYYEKRWIVEDYHKGLKTGCEVEKRQYQTAARLERVTGLLSILAIRLIQIRNAGRTEPQRKAKGLVPKRWLIALCKVHRQRSPKAKQKWLPSRLTIGEFMRGLAC
ncbi:MAG: IS4 family transposase [Pirellulales bacterium]